MTVSSSSALAATSPGRRLALVIGINGPPAPHRAPLASAEADACGMAEVLQQDCCGFELVVPPVSGAQATTERVRKAVRRLARELREGDFGLVFFSGHAEALPGESRWGLAPTIRCVRWSCASHGESIGYHGSLSPILQSSCDGGRWTSPRIS